MQWHQKLALVNLGLMAYQVNIGKKIDEEPNEYYDKYHQIHKNLGYTSFTIYMTSAGLSIFSPPALKYDKGITSMKLHRYLAIIHFAGMSIQPWLGYQASNNPNDYGKFKGSANNHHFVIENVIETLKGNTKKDATPEQSLGVITFIEEVYKMRKVKSTII